MWASWAVEAALALGLVLLAAAEPLPPSPSPPISAASGCKISELKCGNGRCVPLHYYCNGINDCGDSSDEPRYCSKCNRTYYGEIGKTYDLELHRPKEDKIPFICFLTFVANGGEFGDLIQVTFDSFTLGRFTSFTVDGCPDGSLQIAESGRPQMSGAWCGSTWTPAIYYSETSSVTIAVRLLRLSRDHNGYNFDYRMEYKFLRRKAATVRYGGTPPPLFFNSTTPLLPTPTAEEEFYLGDLITGTYCSRIFTDCDRKNCRLQSPNFPGIYPRNLTCYYAVRQHDVPVGKHALITVRQPKGQLVAIRSQAAIYGTTPSTQELKVWEACDDVQDYVTVYDGYTTRDPVVLKFCGGGEAVPETVSSGHELLVEFSTSPFGTFLQPTPMALHGFQLEVKVTFIDAQSPVYTTTKRQCEFWLRGTSKGVLESPRHSLPANTTCLYHLQGVDQAVSPSPVPRRPLSSGRYPDWRHSGSILPPPQYRVWLSVAKFHVAGVDGPQGVQGDKGVCRSYLNVWDGQLWAPTGCNDLYCGAASSASQKSSRYGAGTHSYRPTKVLVAGSGGRRNVALLARYCREHVPRSCDHALLANATRLPRPCNLAESFLSTGDSMTLELKMADSTALRPVKFRALYEFVDLHLDGEPYGLGSCSRRFTTTAEDGQQNKFRSPRDIFLFGRGGSKNISCVYRFEAPSGHRIFLTLHSVTMLGRSCLTLPTKSTDRLHCEGNVTASVRLLEVPWNDQPAVPRHCLCAVAKPALLPFLYTSASRVLELRFDVTGMDAGDDYSRLGFEGTWTAVRKEECRMDTKMRGPSGEIVFRWPGQSEEEVNCESHPRVIIPSQTRYLYVKINGVILRRTTRMGNNSMVISSIHCPTKNRITLHTALYSVLVCPHDSYTYSRDDLVEVFSEGWTTGSGADVHHVAGHLALDRVEIDRLGRELSRSISVEFIGREDGIYSVQWLELSRRRDVPPNGLGLFFMKPDECQYRCPELDACINATVWCDGVEDCPSGVDEALTHCSIIFKLPPLYLFLVVLFILASIFLTGAVLWRTCIRPRPRSILQTRLKSLSSDTAIIDEKGMIS